MSLDRGPFYALLLAATLLPYALLLGTAGIVQGSPAFDGFAQVALFLGAAGHVGASFFFYADADVRGFMRDQPLRYWFAPLAIVVAMGLLFANVGAAARAHALVAFWIWQVHHFTRQNHGILAFASRRRSPRRCSSSRPTLPRRWPTTPGPSTRPRWGSSPAPGCPTWPRAVCATCGPRRCASWCC
jgi:hypothetical protein